MGAHTHTCTVSFGSAASKTNNHQVTIEIKLKRITSIIQHITGTFTGWFSDQIVWCSFILNIKADLQKMVWCIRYPRPSNQWICWKKNEFKLNSFEFFYTNMDAYYGKCTLWLPFSSFYSNPMSLAPQLFHTAYTTL